MLVLGHETFPPILESNPEIAERISEALAERQGALHEVFGNRGSPPPGGETKPREAELRERIRRFFSL